MASTSTKPGSDPPSTMPARVPDAADWGRIMLDEQPLGAIFVDPQLTILFATPAAGRLLQQPLHAGLPLAALLRAWRQREDDAPQTGDDPETAWREWEQGVEFPLGERWLWARLERTRAGNGAAAALWLFDITDLRRSLEHRTEALRFLSHDLRSPQNSIVALTQLHEHDPQAFETCGGMRRIAELARYALSLGDQYLFTSVAGALRHGDFARFDMRAAVRNVIPKLEVAAVYRDVALRLWLADGAAVWVSGVKVFVVRALQNLIDNAIQASRPGGKVTVSLKTLDGHAVILVRDEAGGLPGLVPGHAMTNFDALSAKSSGGYGIGLKLAARIVALHGGTLQAQLNREAGTDLVLRLPRLVLQAGTRSSPHGRRTGPAALERPPLGQSPRQRRSGQG